MYTCINKNYHLCFLSPALSDDTENTKTTETQEQQFDNSIHPLVGAAAGVAIGAAAGAGAAFGLGFVTSCTIQ